MSVFHSQMFHTHIAKVKNRATQKSPRVYIENNHSSKGIKGE